MNTVGTNGDGVTDASEGNVIAANGNVGIEIQGTAATSNVVAGNSIGTDKAGDTGLGNHNTGVGSTRCARQPDRQRLQWCQ